MKFASGTMDLLVALPKPNIYIVQEVIVILETPCLEKKKREFI